MSPSFVAIPDFSLYDITDALALSESQRIWFGPTSAFYRSSIRILFSGLLTRFYHIRRSSHPAELRSENSTCPSLLPAKRVSNQRKSWRVRSPRQNTENLPCLACKRAWTWRRVKSPTKRLSRSTLSLLSKESTLAILPRTHHLLNIAVLVQILLVRFKYSSRLTW